MFAKTKKEEEEEEEHGEWFKVKIHILFYGDNS
jgi:hypothetical protein